MEDKVMFFGSDKRLLEVYRKGQSMLIAIPCDVQCNECGYKEICPALVDGLDNLRREIKRRGIDESII